MIADIRSGGYFFDCQNSARWAPFSLSKTELGKEIAPHIEGRFRQGDIRHCFADISKIRRELGYEPQIRFEEGVPELVAWVRQQTAEDRFEQVEQELAAKALVV